MKTFLILFFATLSITVYSLEQTTVIGKIEKRGNSVRLIRSVEGDVIPSMLQDQTLLDAVNGLNTGDEAVVMGHITYLTSVEGATSLSPVFVIESIKPVSLKELGNLSGTRVEAPLLPLSTVSAYSPSGIPVSTEIASAMTITGSIMLLHSLNTSVVQPQLSQDLNAGLFLFSGALMTGAFIYDYFLTKN